MTTGKITRTIHAHRAHRQAVLENAATLQNLFMKARLSPPVPIAEDPKND
jgi:hypothetical protein